jgi:folate-binding protein YgfZ
MTQTAPHQRLSSPNARLGTYNGAETALSFGDSDNELNALLSGCGLFDLGWRAKIVITGADRVRWLNGMVTNNIKDLPLNHGNYNFLLNSQGRILADMYIYNRGEYLLLDTDHSQREKVMKTMDHFIIMDDVELADSSETLSAIGVCGPKADQILQAAGLNASGLQPLEVRDSVVNNVGISVVRGPQQKPGWYEIWAGSANIEQLWEALANAGAQPVGAEALEQWRIVRGIPRYGQDIREKDLPQETEQAQALNFSKGCYVGQEIVERIRSRAQVHRRFTGFEFHGALPELGKVQQEGKVVAEITTVAQIREKKLGLGYVRRESVPPGSQIEINGSTAKVLDPPFEI